MKLVIAVVQDEDADSLISALVSEQFRVTRVCSTGSLLRTGNTGLFVGVDDHDVSRVLTIVGKTCERRTQVALPYAPALEPGLLYMAENFEVEVGGAIVLTLDVGRFVRL